MINLVLKNVLQIKNFNNIYCYIAEFPKVGLIALLEVMTDTKGAKSRKGARGEAHGPVRS